MADIHDVVRLTCRNPWEKERLCNKLGISETRLDTIIRSGQKEGYAVRTVDRFVFSRAPSVHAETKPISLGSTKPGWHSVACISDTHFGSAHCNVRGIQRFLAKAWKKGCTVCVVPGDVLDGNKTVLLPDQLTSRWDGQVDAVAKALAKAPPFSYVAIDGNHDGYFSASSGLVSGRMLEKELRGQGIDWTFAGTCLGRAKIHGARWHLYHGSGGAGTPNAIRRILNDRIENLEEPADIVAMGHYHKFTTVLKFPERIFGFSPGTFQEKRSEFANRIIRPWNVGGTIVHYRLNHDGSISGHSAEFHPIAGGVWEVEE